MAENSKSIGRAALLSLFVGSATVDFVIANECSDDLYVGYYQEDPLTNPEDPTAGSIYLNIPPQSGNFSGSMFFTFFGCQQENVGAVSGTRGEIQLSMLWNGEIDETSQSGTLSGSLINDTYFTGTYTVDNGKQYITVENCIHYYIAPQGTWAIFPVDEVLPNDVNI